VEEYLLSININIFAPFIPDEGENDNFGEEGDGARLYCQLDCKVMKLNNCF
jgi:hypothetical protein